MKTPNSNHNHLRLGHGQSYPGGATSVGPHNGFIVIPQYMEDNVFIDVYLNYGHQLYHVNPPSTNTINKDDVMIIDDIVDSDDLDNGHNRESLRKNKMFTFDIREFLRKIMTSYDGDKKAIYYQFGLDFPRTQVIYNTLKITSAQALMDRLTVYRHYYVTKKLYLHDVLIMLCNQSSYAFAYEVFYKLYIDSPHKHLIAHNACAEIDTMTSPTVNIRFHCSFDIVDINRGKKVLATINTVTSLDIILDNKKRRGKINKRGILLWDYF